MTSLSSESIEQIKENFEYFDRDKNGQIDFDEFHELLKTISPQSTIEQAEKGFGIIDENGDGRIDFEEFLAWWKTTWWEF
ncbi:MAG: EF-hand domain-containing protein [Pseudomonadota bacterium]